MLVFREEPLLRVDELFEGKIGGEVVCDFVRKLAWNLVFGHLESEGAIRVVMDLLGRLMGRLEVFGEGVVGCLQVVLFVYEDEEAIVDPEVDKFIDNLIVTIAKSSVSSSQLWKLCLEYLAKVPHSINILRLPVSEMLGRGFSDGECLKYVTDLMEMVVESKPKALGGFKLQSMLRLMLTRLIALEESPLE